MVTQNRDLEKKLQRIADRSGRSVQELADDVLSNYVAEVDELESSLNGDLRPDPATPEPKQEELVLLRRRNPSRNQ